MADLALLLEWSRSRLAGAAIERSPYAHVVIDEFLPPEFFARLARGLPALEAYERPEPCVRPGGGERVILGLPAERPSSSGDRSALAALAALSASRELAERLAGVFGVACEGRLLRSQGFLSRDLLPYEIGPHTDVPKRIVSALLYLGGSDAPPEWGTTLFVPIEPGFRCARGAHYGFERFRPAKTIAFRPNRLFAFARTDRSFHGLLSLPPSTLRRDTWLYEVVDDRVRVS